MDPNENLNARFSIVRALQGYTVIGVLCIQTIPVLFSFSFFLSFFLSFPFPFSSFLEPRVKTRRLTFRNYSRRSRLRKLSEEKLFGGNTIEEISSNVCFSSKDLIFITFFFYLYKEFINRIY